MKLQCLYQYNIPTKAFELSLPGLEEYISILQNYPIKLSIIENQGRFRLIAERMSIDGYEMDNDIWIS